MAKSVSLKDIAQHLGLSVTAVSRALRDSKDISQATIKLVKDKAEELGYIPNSLAISLKSGQTKNIVVIINDFQNPFFAAICDKVFKIIIARGYQASLHFSNKHLLTVDDMDQVFRNKFRAVISFVEPLDHVAETFAKRNVPFVLVGINSRNPLVSSVYTDDYLGGHLIGEHFISLKMEKALFLTNSFSETSYRRYSGFSDVILRNNKHVDIIPFDGGSDKVFLDTSIQKITYNNYDFIFCFSDYLAIRLTHELKERNLLTKKMIIFGYDDLNRYYNIIDKTNSVSADYDKMITYSIDLIIQQIENESDYKTVNKMFPVQLSLRKG